MVLLGEVAIRVQLPDQNVTGRINVHFSVKVYMVSGRGGWIAHTELIGVSSCYGELVMLPPVHLLIIDVNKPY